MQDMNSFFASEAGLYIGLALLAVGLMDLAIAWTLFGRRSLPFTFGGHHTKGTVVEVIRDPDKTTGAASVRYQYKDHHGQRKETSVPVKNPQWIENLEKGSVVDVVFRIPNTAQTVNLDEHQSNLTLVIRTHTVLFFAMASTAVLFILIGLYALSVQ